MGTPPGDLVVEEEEAVEAGPSNSALPEDVEEEVEEVGNMCTPPVGEEHLAETQQVRANYSNEEEEESPEPETSRSQRRRFKASNMSFIEMVEMVDILKRADYDGKYGPYPNPNVRKAKIMTKVVKSLQRNFGVR
ncbi:hypothetical protein AB205_0160390 [Aquarana catesbeiana]|uniref:Uncharacterized protein n=1 Tax=Aquarana catesbeiana TaxID=8400 RepID=A0A2G9RSH0_AQUCT|nr:hypothetical protein AB205_0160390 [Aquarana catesbeiana]